MALAKPTGVVATPQESIEGWIAVNWPAVPRATGYNVRFNRSDYRAVGSPWRTLASDGNAFNFHLNHFAYSRPDTGRPYGLQGTSMVFQVQATRGSEVSDWSFPAYGTSPTQRQLATPAAFVVDDGTRTGEVIISWAQVTRATRYVLSFRQQDTPSQDLPWRRRTINGGTTTRYSLILQPGVIYVFAVRAEGSGLQHSEWTRYQEHETRHVAGLATPTGLGVQPSGDGQVLAAWNEVSGASGYEWAFRRTRSRPSTGSEWERTANVGPVSGRLQSVTVRNLVPQQTYYFSVRARSASGYSPWAALVQVTAAGTPTLATPRNLNAVTGDPNDPNIPAGTARLTWSAVTGATSYRIASRKVGQAFNYAAAGLRTVSGGSTTSYNFQGEQGTQYFFAIQAIGVSGAQSEFSTHPVYAVTKSLPRLPAPKNFSVVTSTTADGQIDLSWSSVTGADYYIWMYRTTPTGSYVEQRTADGNTTTAFLAGSNVIQGRTYYFNILTVSAQGVRGNRAGADVQITVGAPATPDVPTNLMIQRRPSGDYWFSWDPVATATHYEYSYRLQSGATFTDFTDTSDVFAIIERLTPGVDYCFTVRAVNGTQTPLRSAEAAPICTGIAALTLPAAPTGVAAIKSPTVDNQIIFTWNKEAQSEQYRWAVQVVGESTWNETLRDPEEGAPAAVFFDGVAGTSYIFRVQGVNSLGAGPWSASTAAVEAGLAVGVGGLTVPGNPTATPSTLYTGVIDLRWDPVPGAVSYTWAWRTGSSGWSWVTTAFTTDTFFGGAAGILYTFQVRANGDSVIGPWSADFTATTTTGAAPGVPTGFTATESLTLPGQILLEWDQGEGVEEYEWQWRTDESTVWTANRIGGNFAIFNGSPGTLYHFALRGWVGNIPGAGFARAMLRTRGAASLVGAGIAGGEFVSVRLPVDIERGATGGPRFNTSIATTLSGRERRIQNWSQGRLRWDVGYGIQGSGGFDRLIAFFYEMRGRARGFRFKDWSDYKVEGFREDGTVVGDAAYIQEGSLYFLAKQYGDPVAGTAYVRKITHPTTETVMLMGGGAIRVDTRDGHIPDPQTQLTFDAAGRITSPPWQGEFDVPVRFDVDEIDVELIREGVGTIPEFPIVELRL